MSVDHLSRLEAMAEEYDMTVDELEWTAESLDMSVDEMMDLVWSTGIRPDELQDAFNFVADMQYTFGEGNVIKGLIGCALPLTDEDRRRQRQPENLIPDEDDVVVDFSKDVEIVSTGSVS